MYIFSNVSLNPLNLQINTEILYMNKLSQRYARALECILYTLTEKIWDFPLLKCNFGVIQHLWCNSTKIPKKSPFSPPYLMGVDQAIRTLETKNLFFFFHCKSNKEFEAALTC